MGSAAFVEQTAGVNRGQTETETLGGFAENVGIDGGGPGVVGRMIGALKAERSAKKFCVTTMVTTRIRAIPS